MPNTPHRYPHYALRIATPAVDKPKHIAGHNGHSANKKIEQLILIHIDAYKKTHGEIILTAEDYEFIRKGSFQ